MTKVRPKPAGRWWPDLWICLLLLAATLAVYSQVSHYDFVNYDDPEYVGENIHVRAGLSADSLVWALASFDAANWFPLTWITHMADYQFFGMESGWHHLTDVWLHALNALLLFAVLKRMTGARWPSALVAGASVLTFLAQRSSGAVAPLAGTPLVLRLENALVSYLVYIGGMLWPAGLALAGISLVVARLRRAQPYLAVGWCWYLGTLVPVIGLVQVGTQSHADRYTYVPMIGLTIMLAWGAAELVRRRPRARNAVIAAAVAACSASLSVTWFQIQYWAFTETLLGHTL